MCDHLAAHSELYAAFVDTEDGSFEQHVSRMRQDGTYGGNMEIVAFARGMGVDVAVHQAGSSVWIVSGDMENEQGQNRENEQTRLLHIGTHVVWTLGHRWPSNTSW